MAYGRYRPRRLSYRGYSPVKRITGSSDPTLWINTYLSPPFPVSRRQLGKLSPPLLNEFRLSGNRVISPIGHFPEALESGRNLVYWNLALKWLEPRFRRGYSRSPSTTFFGSRGDIDDIFLSLYYGLKDALSFDDIDGFFEAAYNVAKIFEALSKLLRGGLHPQLYAEILDIALHFTPILSVYVPDYMFLLIQCMHRMTGDDTATVKRMLDAITPPNREPLAQLALEGYSTTRDTVSEKIVHLLEDNPINPLGAPFW